MSTSTRDANERDNLNSSIRSSFTSRKPIELVSSEKAAPTTGKDTTPDHADGNAAPAMYVAFPCFSQ